MVTILASKCREFSIGGVIIYACIKVLQFQINYDWKWHYFKAIECSLIVHVEIFAEDIFAEPFNVYFDCTTSPHHFPFNETTSIWPVIIVIVVTVVLTVAIAAVFRINYFCLDVMEFSSYENDYLCVTCPRGQTREWNKEAL